MKGFSDFNNLNVTPQVLLKEETFVNLQIPTNHNGFLSLKSDIFMFKKRSLKMFSSSVLFPRKQCVPF